MKRTCRFAIEREYVNMNRELHNSQWTIPPAFRWSYYRKLENALKKILKEDPVWGLTSEYQATRQLAVFLLLEETG